MKNIKKIIAHYQRVMCKLDQGKLTEKQAVKHLRPEDFFRLLQSEQFSFIQPPRTTMTGVGVSPGYAVGKLSFAARPEEKKVILAKEKITLRDYSAIRNAAAVIIMRGGTTSPGVLMARSLGVPVVVVSDPKISIDTVRHCLMIGNKVVNQGEDVAIDSYQGKVIVGDIKILNSIPELDVRRMVTLINKMGKNNVLPFVSSVDQAVEVSTKGFGLAVRSEDLIASNPKMLKRFQEYITAKDEKKKEACLKTLLELQFRQYREIFYSSKNQPIIIRLFDPPFSEFFPSIEELLTDLFGFKESLNTTNNAFKRAVLQRKIRKTAALLSAARNLNEDNKMLGHRGCRYAFTHPDLYRSQIDSIFLALAKAFKRTIPCCVNISIPMVIDPQEVRILKTMIKKAEAAIEKQYRVKLTYHLGVAIETPRAVALAEQLAAEVDFFSFGTNDLTQLVMGISRTDCNSFLSAYQNYGILPNNPFDKIDFIVADFISQAVEAAYRTNKNIFFFAPVKDFRDAKMIRKLLGNRGYIVCHPALTPVIKLSLMQ